MVFIRKEMKERGSSSPGRIQRRTALAPLLPVLEDNLDMKPPKSMPRERAGHLIQGFPTCPRKYIAPKDG